MSIPTVALRPKHDRRARSGHPWVFSNELADGVGGLPRGGVVDVVDAKGAFLGRGYANPQSLIAVRLFASKHDDIDSEGFWVRRLQAAVAHRAVVCPGRNDLRVVFGEGDRLPGLVIDRFGGVVSVQLTTLGTESRKDLIEHAVREVLAPTGAVLRSEGPARQREGLEDERRVWFGDVPDLVTIDELGVRLTAAPLDGQKTGHFYDQAVNRAFAGPLCAGRSVLDVYANGAAWALQALVNGATKAVAIDKSEACCERMVENAELNGVSDKLTPICDEGRKTLQLMVQQGHRYDMVMLDPPAFAKSRKAVGAALKGYRDINALGLTLLRPGGILFTSSCSFHVEEDRFVAEVVAAAKQVGRRLRVVRRGEQAPDHPVRRDLHVALGGVASSCPLLAEESGRRMVGEKASESKHLALARRLGTFHANWVTGLIDGRRMHARLGRNGHHGARHGLSAGGHPRVHALVDDAVEDPRGGPDGRRPAGSRGDGGHHVPLRHAQRLADRRLRPAEP